MPADGSGGGQHVVLEVEVGDCRKAAGIFLYFISDCGSHDSGRVEVEALRSLCPASGYSFPYCPLHRVKGHRRDIHARKDVASDLLPVLDQPPVALGRSAFNYYLHCLSLKYASTAVRT